MIVACDRACVAIPSARSCRRQFSLALAERARLSREIHDTLLQSLVGVALQFDGIANALGPSSVSAREQLTRIRRQVEAYIREARQSIWDLRSPILETHDLAAALRAFAKESIGDKPVRFTSRGQRATTRAVLPRLTTNCCASGRRRSPTPSATRRPGAFTSRSHSVPRRSCCAWKTTAAASTGIRPHVDDAGHYGLTTMRERAEELGGTFTITSSAGRGTVIEAAIPRSGHTRE